MKRIVLFLLGSFILLLSACAPISTATPRREEPTRKPTTKPATQSDNQISIPATNDYPPSGILDQLAWFGTGGPEGHVPPCGNCSAKIDGGKLYLKNFKPNQSLKLMIYRNTGFDSCGSENAEFVTMAKIKVDATGSLSTSIRGATSDLFINTVLDANTGDVEIDTLVLIANACGSSTTNKVSSSSCPGAPPQRIKVNDKVYVCTASDTVKLREGAGKNFKVLKSLVPGADLKVIGGPKCADNWSWWKVETESGFVGWIAEGGDNVDPYFICPK
jgi:hypothetical protein